MPRYEDLVVLPWNKVPWNPYRNPPGMSIRSLLFVDEDHRHILADPKKGAAVISGKVVTPIAKKIHSMSPRE